MTEPVDVAIVGSGNIGTDLMYKLLRRPGAMRLKLVAGVDPGSDGLARARAEGVETTHEGIGPVLEDPDVAIVFDATSAKAHLRHAELLRGAGKRAIDLTPAAVGPHVVPTANLGEHVDAANVNLLTCGAQATVPIVHAVSRVTPLLYAEMVSTISSRSAGPGTRQNIDEFTSTTARGLREIGGARAAKAIIILNPADPPIKMRNSVYLVPEGEFDLEAVRAAVATVVADVQVAVPGYRLKGEPVLVERDTPWGRRQVIVTLLEVTGAGDYLPTYAGNLDIMTSSAQAVGEEIAARLGRRPELAA